MKRTLVMAALCVLPVLAMAGKKDKGPSPDHANHFKDVKLTGTDIKVGVKDAWARDYETKMKVLVANDTADYVLWKAGDSRLDANGNELAFDRARDLVIAPKGQGSRVLGIKDSAGLHQDGLVLHAKGLHLVPRNAPVVPADDFRLPLERSDLKAGNNFSCTVPKKIKQETDETQVRFKCRYEGSAIGIVNPNAIQVRLEDQQVFASDGRVKEPMVLQGGDEFKFDAIFHISAKVIDMQFAEMHIVFNDTFREGEPRAMDPVAVKLELDPDLTAEKND